MAYFSTIPSKQSFMRKIIFLSTVLIAFMSSAFKPIAGLDDVINALKSGNAQELSRYIDDNVEISLPDKSDNYSRSQALMVLKDFFNNNVVTGFDVQFKGENGSGQYCIGNLKTKAGVYRTTVFMKKKDDKQLIKEIRFKPN
jgi:antitoxin component YwqK of YwqJK toxin-antitoxin module